VLVAVMDRDPADLWLEQIQAHKQVGERVVSDAVTSEKPLAIEDATIGKQAVQGVGAFS
jgi:hypothetical protein